MPLLHDAVTLRGLVCPNRIFMAPLTRQRAKAPGDVPGELQAEHYAQRAGFGAIITEATQISPEGKGYPNTPGIYSDEQVAGWRIVTARPSTHTSPLSAGTMPNSACANSVRPAPTSPAKPSTSP